MTPIFQTRRLLNTSAEGTMGTPVSIHRRSVRAAGQAPAAVHLRLLSEFQLVVNGAAITLPHGVERIVAFLGISQVPVGRTRLASALWPDVGDDRSHHDLRSALWRLRRIAPVIGEEDRRLTLAPEVHVDLADINDLTQSLIVEPLPPVLDRVPDLVRAEEILPGWEEDWLVVERERFRVTRVRALERCAGALLEAGEYAGALDAAQASVATEPFRETAHRLVIRVHLAEGNNAEAVRAFRAYRTLMVEELGIAPSPMMAELVAPLGVLELR
ncbi:AfsR/SARP family transcriptional regulator [Mycolicibacterium litorale]|uniref:AfsR/SARP family transcriptional regulator n=1 Tax=Mycolicibacterium litorale TaxID=758802 RepID=UPI003CF27E72